MFDEEEVRERFVKADLRLRAEVRLIEIRTRYDIDENTALLILDEAVACGNTDEEVTFALDGIAASWVGESSAWSEAASRVDARLGEPGTSLVELLGKAQGEMAKIVGGSVSSKP